MYITVYISGLWRVGFSHCLVWRKWYTYIAQKQIVLCWHLMASTVSMQPQWNHSYLCADYMCMALCYVNMHVWTRPLFFFRVIAWFWGMEGARRYGWMVLLFLESGCIVTQWWEGGGHCSVVMVCSMTWYFAATTAWDFVLTFLS
jgi:hypothetical protein